MTFEGQYYRTNKATIYDRPMRPVPIYVAAAGALVAKYAGRSGDGFICTSGKQPELYTETLLPNVAAGLAAAGMPKPGYDRMIEVKVSFDTDRQRAMEDTRHWAALALSPEEKMSVEDPARDGAAGGCPAARARRQPLDRLGRSGGAGGEDRLLCRPRLQPPRLPRAGPGPGALPEPLWGARCCRCCGAASGERRAAPDGASRPAPRPAPATTSPRCWPMPWRARTCRRDRATCSPWRRRW